MKNDFILAVLEDVCTQLELSNSFLGLGSDSPFFNDSCKVVEARFTISKLIDVLKLTIKYAKD